MGASNYAMKLILGVIFTLLLVVTFPPLYAKYISNDVAVKSAYAIDESIISAVNMISSINGYAKINISVNCNKCSKCRISFYNNSRYIKTGVTYVPEILTLEQDGIESSFGLFTLSNFTAPEKIIDCTTPKKLIIEKNKENITIYEEEWTGEVCGGLNEPCCNGKCAEGFSCNSTGYCKKCKRFCPPKSCSGDWWSRRTCGNGCTTKQSCIDETEDVPSCTYKVMSWGCLTRHCEADCYVDCERCPS